MMYIYIYTYYAIHIYYDICEFHVSSLMNCFIMVVKSRSVPTSVNDDSTNQEVYSRPNDITVVAQVHMQRGWEKRHRVHSSSWGQLHW